MQRHLCRTCRRPLSWCQPLDGDDGWWEHPEVDGDVGHPADPVPDIGLSSVSRCDFCSSTIPVVVFPADSFDTVIDVEPEDPTLMVVNHPSRSVGGWAACASCAELVEEGNAERLAVRAFAHHKAQLPPSIVAQVGVEANTVALHSLRSLYNAFLRFRTGPPESIATYSENP